MSFYNARWYDAQLGRFVSADTLVPSPGNPQSLNRFAYVVNNPLALVDPSGHAYERGAGGGGGKPKTSNQPDARILTRWLAKELNRYATLPEGQYLREMNNAANRTAGQVSLPISLPLKALWTFDYFKQIVQDGAPLDVKDQVLTRLGSTIKIGDYWFEYSTVGNITYGFYGSAWGFSRQILHLGAGKAQRDDYHRNPETTPLGPIWYYNDTPDDYYAIEFGMLLYDEAYLPDGLVTEDEITALLTDFTHLDKMAIRPRPPGNAFHPEWPYEAGYFDNVRTPPMPPEAFPSFYP